MHSIAVISDIHGNITALEEVLKDIKRRGIPEIICLGDLIGKGPRSSSAVDICKSECSIILKGNWDDIIVRNPNMNEITKWHSHQLGEERIKFLSELPNCYNFLFHNKRIRLFHASQESVHSRIHMYDTVEKHMSMFKNTELTGNGKTPDIVGYGDIHSAFMKSVNNKILFNAGSVGNPLDINQASYVIIHHDNDTNSEISFQFMRIKYDIEKELKVAKKSGMPLYEEYENELLTAIYRGIKK